MVNMLGLSFIPILSPEIAFISLIQENSWLFIPAVVLLRLRKVFTSQVLLLAGFFIARNLASDALLIALMILQIGLVIWLAVRLFIDIEWSYARRLEKTHFLPRDITKGGNAGIREYRF